MNHKIIFLMCTYSFWLCPMQQLSLSNITNNSLIKLFAQNLSRGVYKGEIIHHQSGDIRISVNRPEMHVAIDYNDELDNPPKHTLVYVMTVPRFCQLCKVKNETEERRCPLKY